LFGNRQPLLIRVTTAAHTTFKPVTATLRGPRSHQTSASLAMLVAAEVHTSERPLATVDLVPA